MIFAAPVTSIFRLAWPDSVEVSDLLLEDLGQTAEEAKCNVSSPKYCN